MKTFLTLFLPFAFMVSLSGASRADNPYEFDWNSRNDMRGAWYLCSPTGFSAGDCPKVLEKCWQAPMIYFKRRKHKFTVATYCVDAFNFSVTVDNVTDALAEAKRRVAQGIPFGE